MIFTESTIYIEVLSMEMFTRPFKGIIKFPFYKLDNYHKVHQHIKIVKDRALEHVALTSLEN